MLKIGDFARLGQVSVRMLRHYDSLGLLTPAHVDAHSGYRSYSAAQLARLNRLVALKELGFTLEQVHDLLAGDHEPGHLMEMLRLRRDQLRAEQQAGRRRLADVEARLRLIEREGTMSEFEFTTKALPRLRVAHLSAHAESQPEIGPTIGPLYERLATALQTVGAPLGPALAYYDDDAEGMTVHAAWEYAGAEADGFEVAELPAVPQALTTTYVGPIAGIAAPWQAAGKRAEDLGLTLDGPCREVYLTMPDDESGDWVIEIQQPVRAARG